jgi:hypothetical protein
MLGNLSKGGARNDDIKTVLDSLTTTIEAINQRLAGGAGGEGTGQQLRQLAGNIQYIYDALAQVVKQQAELKAALAALQGGMTKTMSESLQSAMTDVRRLTQSIETSDSLATTQKAAPGTAIDPGAATVLDLRKRLEQLILIHTEEAELFRRQNQMLQEKLALIEKKLTRSGKE